MENQHIQDCAHCSGTGTCTHGKNGVGCSACINKNELTPKWYSKTHDFTGLACGTCGGLGKTDTVTYRLNNRATPILAMTIIFGCFTMIFFFALIRVDHLSEILTFCGTLIGSVVGYYFGGKNGSQNN